MKDKYLSWPGSGALLTILLGGAPFLVYLAERNVGSLTDEENWYRTGANHGPWRWGLEGLMGFYPLLVLLLATLVMSFSRGMARKKWGVFLFGLSLAVAKISLLVGQLYFLGWTVD